MIVCKGCGFANADGERFCESCGSYLPWTGHEVEPGEPEPAAVDDEIEPKKGWWARIKAFLTGEASRGGSDH